MTITAIAKPLPGERVIELSPADAAATSNAIRATAARIRFSMAFLSGGRLARSSSTGCLS